MSPATIRLGFWGWRGRGGGLRFGAWGLVGEIYGLGFRVFLGSYEWELHGFGTRVLILTRFSPKPGDPNPY